MTILITADDVKDTHCYNESVADAVETDYISRGFDNIQIKRQDKDYYHLDFGGSLLATMKPARIGVLSFWPHQAIGVLDSLRGVDRGGYLKLHGRYSCFCLPVEVAAEIRQELETRMAEFVAMADTQFNEWHTGRSNNI